MGEPQFTEGEISLVESAPGKALENSSMQLDGVVINPEETERPLENTKLMDNQSDKQGASAALSSRRITRSSSKTKQYSSPSSKVLPTAGSLKNTKLINNQSDKQGASAALSSRKMTRSRSKTKHYSSPSSRVLPTAGPLKNTKLMDNQSGKQGASAALSSRKMTRSSSKTKHYSSPSSRVLPTAGPLKNTMLNDNQSDKQGASAALSSQKMTTSSSKTKHYSSPSSRVLPTVGAYAVQCVKCFKWRLIPDKEKYEAIRHCASADPWVCNRASAWRPNASCDDPADLSQDITRRWIIDRPNIPCPPTGWERLLSLRGEGTCRFADVYYITPCGRKLRSRVEVEKFLKDNPQYAKEGVDISQFNYMIPRPLHDSYLGKRRASEAQNRGNTGRNAKTKISSH